VRTSVRTGNLPSFCAAIVVVAIARPPLGWAPQ